jgi:hypothetical protein
MREAQCVRWFYDLTLSFVIGERAAVVDGITD